MPVKKGPFHGVKIPEGGFPVIAADCPWGFVTRSPKGLEGRPMHYPRMSVAEICALPVRELAAKNCWLFLWANGPLLPQAFDVIRAWGFRYSAQGFTWAKLKPTAEVILQSRLSAGSAVPTVKMFFSEDSFNQGMGYTTRHNPELCLLARRGKPPRMAKDVQELLIAPMREHSRKPDEFYDRVMRFAAGPYLELFSRQGRPGWTAWGNETKKFDDFHAEGAIKL